MEIMYLVIGIIIYVIASATGHNGRYSRFRDVNYRRYGLIGVDDDFSLDTDSRLESIRDEYSRRLELYYAEHKPRTYLKNNFCELRLIVDGNEVYFYCKEKTDGRHKGQFFYVRGNRDHASTMWGIIDMMFNKCTDYTQVRNLYRRLNKGYTTVGGMKYFYEPSLKKYPNFNDNFAQNEYCSLELKQMELGKFVIVCSEIWSKKPKQFIIKGNKYLLLKMISDFAEERNKFKNYSDLYATYYSHKDCDVMELSDEKKKLMSNKNTEQAAVQTERSEPKKPEPVKYIHADIDEAQNNKTIQNDEKKESDNTEQTNIKKYNERNLDL